MAVVDPYKDLQLKSTDPYSSLAPKNNSEDPYKALAPYEQKKQFNFDSPKKSFRIKIIEI